MKLDTKIHILVTSYDMNISRAIEITKKKKKSRRGGIKTKAHSTKNLASKNPPL